MLELVCSDYKSTYDTVCLLTDLQNYWQFFWISNEFGRTVSVVSLISQSRTHAFELIGKRCCRDNDWLETYVDDNGKVYKKARIYDILHPMYENNRGDQQDEDELYDLMDPIERKRFKEFKDEKLLLSVITSSDLLGKTLESMENSDFGLREDQERHLSNIL